MLLCLRRRVFALLFVSVAVLLGAFGGKGAMAQEGFVAAGAANWGSGSATPPLPAHQSGDLLIAVVSKNS